MPIGSRMVLAERDRVPTRNLTPARAAKLQQQQTVQFTQAQLDQQAFNALPGAAEYNADQAYLSGWIKAGGLPSTRAQNESYYKLLPALSRGHLVPNGYPMDYGGFLLQDNTLPRIERIVPGQEKNTTFTVTPTKVSGIAALPAGITPAAFMALPGTVVYTRNAKGQPITWFNRKYLTMFSYQPHVEFNNAYVHGRVFLDPSSSYANEQFAAWTEPTYLQVLVRDAVVVVTAIFAGYALGTALDGTAAAGGTGAGAGAGAGADAGAGAGAGGGGLAPTTYEPATFTGEVAQPVTEVDQGLSTTSIATLGGNGAVGTGLTLGDVLGAGASVLKGITGAAAAVIGIKQATAADQARAGAPAITPAGSAPPLKKTPTAAIAAAGLAGLGLLLLLAR